MGIARNLSGLALVLAALLCGCRSRETVATNVVLVTLDTTRADRLGAYGHADGRTPNLDRLAREGRIFEEAWTTAPVTLPSHASILTGTYPETHGARDNTIYVLGDRENLTLAEILRDRGYATGAVVSAFVLDRRFGLAQGFDLYEDDPNAMAAGGPRLDPERRAADATRTALATARALSGRGKPLFLWVHYFDPHTPFDPPEPYRSLYPTTATDRYSGYDGEIAYCDREIGRLFDGLSEMGALDRAVVVVVGDHGEGLESPHEESSHGILLFEETVRVPFLVWESPGASRESTTASNRGTIPGAVSVVDVLPTLLDLLGLPAPVEIPGVSLVGALRGAPPPRGRALLAETLHPFDLYAWSPLAAVRADAWKLVRSPAPELYDLAADPGEARNLLSDRADEAARLAAVLDETRRRWERAPGEAAPALSEEEEAKLRSLGYLAPAGAARVPPSPEAYPDKDPRVLLPLHVSLQLAAGALGDGDLPRADALLREVLAKDPENVLALRYRGDLLAQSGDLDGAIDSYRRATTLHTGMHELEDNLGVLLMSRGDALRQGGRLAEAAASYREAEAAFLRAIEAFPRHHFAMSNLATLLLQWIPQPRPAEAEAWLRRAIEIDPRAHLSHLVYGWLLESAGRVDEAIAELEIARGLRETGFGEYLLGECLLAKGDREGARRRFERALALEPTLAEARARLGR